LQRQDKYAEVRNVAPSQNSASDCTINTTLGVEQREWI
jgi:hypothetical protein